MRFRFEGCELDTDVYRLTVAGRIGPVEPQVFDVLVYLVEHRSRVVTKEELLDNVWGDRFVSESALTSRRGELGGLAGPLPGQAVVGDEAAS